MLTMSLFLESGYSNDIRITPCRTASLHYSLSTVWHSAQTVYKQREVLFACMHCVAR